MMDVFLINSPSIAVQNNVHEFTKRGYNVDKEITRQLDLVCKQILEDIPAAKSIILTGGFARGEGAVKIKGREVYPFNDYDITVVAESPMSKERIDEVAVNAAGKLGLRGIEYFYAFKKDEQELEKNFYIDLKVVTPRELMKMPPRIRNYELRNHGLVLYGQDLKGLIPDFSLKDIPHSEGAKLLLDRMSQLAEYFSIRGEYDDYVLTYMIQQAYTACCTTLLLVSGKYEIGYEKSMNIFFETYKSDFPELYEKIPDLHKQIKKYVEWKRKPDKLPDKNVEAAWFRARSDLFEAAMFFFGKFLGEEIKDLKDFKKAILKMGWKFHRPFLECKLNGLARVLHPLAVFYLKYKYFKRVRRQRGRFFGVFLSFKSPDELIFSAVPLVLMCLEKKDGKFIVDEKMHDEAVKLLKNIYPLRKKLEDWDDLTLYYAEAYIAFFMQKLG